MVKFLLSLLTVFVIAAPCRAASDGVADEFRKLSNAESGTLLKQAYVYIEKCQYDSALIYYSAVANRYDETANDRKAADNATNALYNIGIIYMVGYYNYGKSFDYLLQAQEVAEKYQLDEHLSNIYNSIATILQASLIGFPKADGEEVMDLLRKGYYCTLRVKDADGASIALSNMIQLGFSAPKPFSIDKEISIYRSTRLPNNKHLKTTLTLCDAYKQYCNKHYTEAIALLKKTFHADLATPLAYRAILANYSCAINIYTSMGDLPGAITMAKEAIETSKTYHADDYLTEFYGLLYKTYVLTGDTTMSQHYEYLYLKNSERVFSKGNLPSVKSIAFQHELSKAIEQVKTLSEHRRLQNILLISALSVLCIIGVLLFRLYRAYGKIRQTNRYLYEKNLELLASEKKAREERAAAAAANPATILAKEKSTDDGEKYKSSRLSDEDTHELFLHIRHTMETSDDIYQMGFNIDKLSELVHSRPRYVSQAINQESGGNFNALLNDYRIKEVCRRINENEEYTRMTVEAIAESVGFKSRTSFGGLFKTMTGLSPSAYQHMAREKNA